MKCKTVVVSLGLLLGFIACYAQKPGSTVDQTIRNLEGEIETALSKGDSTTLERLLAADYIEIDAQGNTKDKAHVLALARARRAAPPVKSVGPEKTVDELAIRLHGDTAVVTGLTTIKYQFMDYQTSDPKQTQGPEIVDQERFMRVYSRAGSQWQLLAWQTTAVPKRLPSPAPPER
jgi:hypothetical protein